MPHVMHYFVGNHPAQKSNYLEVFVMHVCACACLCMISFLGTTGFGGCYVYQEAGRYCVVPKITLTAARNASKRLFGPPKRAFCCILSKGEKLLFCFLKALKFFYLDIYNQYFFYSSEFFFWFGLLTKLRDIYNYVE